MTPGEIIATLKLEPFRISHADVLEMTYPMIRALFRHHNRMQEAARVPRHGSMPMGISPPPFQVPA